MSKVTETVTPLLKPILEKYDFYLYDIEFVSESGSWYLRVYIDKTGGITIEDCALVSDELSEKLDSIEPDPIPQAYYLEVSSPGAERPLKKDSDFQSAIGEYVNVSLYAPIKGNKVFEGTLKDIQDDTLFVEYNDKSVMRTVEIPKSSIAKARLAIKFD
ncbi:ribosome maturation factor RimP [Apilactobacillus xinyiensis]|uniref:Ribosome maturation factor RimP n=1 Tax=Apilactobacillus xinyiensis TaxID=2841032 RepID=A0ABT0I129_9LACO|nr:ribosome maturation factor RimP [Apilactobacillus xinyiensis]MCK8624027.1 ribosome maturation factor RimP [Apilactobacillus xinyiensis]MCL0311619.1 ribosome maturation factor RimP [Apilactobacillus xinyiensis]MCL0318236.1 ribosome maturation factor RimP [Apilactobacillus xinyiensis]MCL0330004.1 ribosome maturation factor RimP [Apilactobacillus xinyiensis]